MHILQRDHYDPVQQAMSELAIGRYGFLMNVAFVLLGLGVLSLAYGLRRTVSRAVAGPALLALVGILLVLSGVFQTDPRGIPQTTESTIHQAIGFAAFVTVMIAMLSCAWRFRRDPRWRPFARPTLLWAVATIGAFFLFPLLQATASGVGQRVFVAAWLSWTLVAALRLRALPDRPMQTTGQSPG